MSTIGNGYGSECHLLRWMGRHRNSLNKAVLHAIRLSGQNQTINWIDFGFNDDETTWYDAEPSRLNFLTDEDTKSNWDWPKTGKQQSWDGVGFIKPLFSLTDVSSKQIVLLEAKAHVGEIYSPCQAGEDSARKIEDILLRTAADLNIVDFDNVRVQWLEKYYQTANRLATYNYLKKSGFSPYLVFLYFLNDQHENSTCPSKVEEWESTLTKMKNEMGIEDVFVKENIFELFLDVRSDERGWTSSPEEFVLK